MLQHLFSWLAHDCPFGQQCPSLNTSSEDKALINALQYAKPLTDPKMAAATLVSATADAMVTAANNIGGMR